ncbi:cytochrome C oxidase subunit II [Paenibacillus yonginensis]|uniref:Cytochrome C oxidase subunit II n=1 Tax=Paenibacillus yonginensis TaxID=1462996 RepID=A0A1B1MWS0_9BACL|nr:cupredoxin domain-containing protein [Paenibacillus yonginensis]ANS73630.1 cytochrome C oxidase subunit II [Paenibacillus yonginensis]
MKKRMFSLIAGALLLILAACTRESGQANNEEANKPVPEAETQLVVKAVNYEFDQKVYHLKAGVPVQITLDNEDGNHGLRIPELGVKLDQAQPSTVITPDKAGEYEMSCSIPCGPGHKAMKAQVIVE